MRAVVTEIRGTSAAVLCENGEVRLVPAQKYRVGQEITLTESRRRVRRPLMWAACVAALCAMATTSVYAVCDPYSSVTVDGAESVEYTLNRFDWVIDTRISGEKPPESEDVPRFIHAKDAVSRAVEREHDRGREDVSITVSSHDSGRAESLRDMFADGETRLAESRCGHRPPCVRTAPPAEESRASA